MSQEHVRNKENEITFEKVSSPHEAMFFVLSYLPLFELLSMSLVCKSLRDAIDTDILPWMNIVVQRPLNSRISDGSLMKIVSKATGMLQALALMNCSRITDNGLLRVVEQNSYIRKLHIPSCTSLSPEGIIKAVELLTKTNHKLKSLEIDGIYGITKEDLKTLQNLINPNHPTPQNQDKMFYHNYKKFSTLTNEEMKRSIDVDICPKCDEVRIVFDCPRVSCLCRGCSFCIPRCKECGVCFTGFHELEDAACEDALCLECWLRLPKCSFCNKPYCNEHADQKMEILGGSGFVCADCHFKFSL